MIEDFRGGHHHGFWGGRPRPWGWGYPGAFAGGLLLGSTLGGYGYPYGGFGYGYGYPSYGAGFGYGGYPFHGLGYGGYPFHGLGCGCPTIYC